MKHLSAARGWNWRRRTFLKGVGASGAVIGIGATTVGRPQHGSAPTPLEASPSAVAFVHYAALAGGMAGVEGDAPAEPLAVYGFPTHPAMVGRDPTGALFDTTVPTVSADDQRIEYVLRFGGEATPYRLAHLGDGTYRAVDATVTFEWSEEELFPLPFLEVGSTYRADVREYVQLYGPGEPFDWSTTRTDLVDPDSGQVVVSMLSVVWDDDGPTNDAPTVRGDPGRGVMDPEGPVAPTFPSSLTPTVDGLDIAGAAAALAALEPVGDR